MRFTGLTANPGQVSGRVCIVRDSNDFGHCDPDSIAVLVGIKPTAALAKKVKGILAIHGGITSHAAIVARENNKPAIVGLQEEILKHLANGNLISFSADSGEVNI